MAPRPPRLCHLMSLAQHRLLKSIDAVYKEALGINASAITALIGRMEDARLVRRRASAEDGRACRLFATAEGIAKAAAAKPLLTRLNARLTQGFGERGRHGRTLPQRHPRAVLA